MDFRFSVGTWPRSTETLNVSADELNRTREHHTIRLKDRMKTLTWSILGDIIDCPDQPQRGGKSFAFKTMGDAVSVGSRTRGSRTRTRRVGSYGDHTNACLLFRKWVEGQ
jgi:hypothetical protein